MDTIKDRLREIPTQDEYEFQRRLEFIESVHHCPLCGSQLELAHEVNYLDRAVKEEAFCPSCEIRTRNETFSLQ